MLNEYAGYDLSTLVDMLSTHTGNYTRMITDTYSPRDDIAKIKEKILLIQEAIRTRQEFDNNITTS